MGSKLDLDDVAATSPEAAGELARTRGLISDMRHFIKATSALFQVLPEERRTGHLAGIAAGLVKRADEVLGTDTSQEGDG